MEVKRGFDNSQICDILYTSWQLPNSILHLRRHSEVLSKSHGNKADRIKVTKILEKSQEQESLIRNQCMGELSKKSNEFNRASARDDNTNVPNENDTQKTSDILRLK